MGTGYPYSFAVGFLETHTWASQGPTSSIIPLKLLRAVVQVSPRVEINIEQYLSSPYIQDFTTSPFLAPNPGNWHTKKTKTEMKTKLKQIKPGPSKGSTTRLAKGNNSC